MNEYHLVIRHQQIHPAHYVAEFYAARSTMLVARGNGPSPELAVMDAAKHWGDPLYGVGVR